MIQRNPPPLPEWANPDIALPILRDDLGYSAGARNDQKIKNAFTGALGELDTRDGLLCRTLVPAVQDAIVTRSPMFLPMPPVIAVNGFERLVGNEWVETEIAYRLETGGRLYVSSPLGCALRVVYLAGYLDGQEPANLMTALRLMVRQEIDGHTDARAALIASRLRGLKVPA